MEMILWDHFDSGGSDGGFVSFVSASRRPRRCSTTLPMIKDTRQAWKVAYPLREVLFLVVCGTIASGDDYDDIVDWGQGTSGLPARLCRIPLRHPLRRLAALRHEPHRPGVHGLLFVLGGGMLAGQARPGGNRWQDLAPQPTIARPARRPCIWYQPSPPTAAGAGPGGCL